jgi:hypothetical protein
MRSILWMSSRAPSSPFSIGCVALPQPRSRMALAAAMRAGGGALVFRITPTRTFSAVFVWLRAIERISVMVLVIAFFLLETLSFGRLATRRVHVIHHEIVGQHHGSEDTRGTILCVIAFCTEGETNDFCGHDNATAKAMGSENAGK